MKHYLLIIIVLGLTNNSFAQQFSNLYTALIKKADSLYNIHEYANSAHTYAQAFNANNGIAKQGDRYNAACSWALCGNTDSSFFQLEKIANEMKYSNYNHITTDPDLNELHADNRWKTLLTVILRNKEKLEENYDKPLVKILDTIYVEDQKYRQQVEEINKKFGWDSEEMKAHWKLIAEKDSINLIQIKHILDTRGWLGADSIG